MNVKMVPVSAIKMGKFNPVSRTEDKKLRTLEESIVERGFLHEFPIIVGNDGCTIGDGHRRYTVARKLSLDVVPVIFSDLSAEDVYALQNERLNPNGKELLEATTRGIDVEMLPKKIQKHFKTIIELCGNEALEYLVERNLSPSNIVWVKKTLQYIARQAPETVIDTDYGYKVLVWMSSNNQSYRVRVFTDNGENVDILLNSIRSNKPLPRPKV